MDGRQINQAGRAALTLTQLAQAIGNSVRTNPSLQGAWVIAELSDVRVSGGHCYMELIEKNASGNTVAKLRATVWANQLRMIQTKFTSATGRQIGSGIKVLLYGSASHHPVYGLSFSVTDIDPAYTLGDMERLRREILERLRYEGILERNKQLHIPWAPQRIAVISAAGAAGYGDFLNQLDSAQEGFVFYPFLFGAVMQGERTAASVIEALGLIEHTVDLWDCVVIIRGGGATTDLNGFDNYELARRVALCPLPVIVGIGHERDRTVLDEIAHTRCKTPTAVAAYLIDDLRQSYNRAAQCMDYIVRQGAALTNGERQRLHNAENMLPASAGRCLDSARSYLRFVAAGLPSVVGNRTSAATARLDSLAAMIGSVSSNVTERATARLCSLAAMIEPVSANVTERAVGRLNNVCSRLGMAATSAAERSRQQLQRISDVVQALSPNNTLRRGYSVTRVDGRAVTDASKLAPGTRLTTQLYNGTIESEVTALSENTPT